MKYYVFDNEATAVAAENAISNIGGVPVTGVNAKTGILAVNKCKTERWATPQERLDGKWVFPYVGDDKIAEYGSEVEDNFNTAFTYVFEEYDANWFPQEEE